MPIALFRFQLEKGGKKFPCPNCGKRRFVRYVDTATGERLPEQFGRCDREQNCGYHSKPERQSTDTFHRVKMPTPPPPSFMQSELMAASVAHGNSNTFAVWLKQRFGEQAANDALERYNVGSSKKWNGATVFWQVDTIGRIRMGKIMLYDLTGHRVKEPFPHITNVHSVLRLENFNLLQCFFGEHLLKERPSDPVALVESEKTAIVASIYFPEMVWIATGGKNGCKWKEPEVQNILKGRNVTLFPDLGAYQDWKRNASKMKGMTVSVNTLLQSHASDVDKQKGLDISDFLLRFEPPTKQKAVEVKTATSSTITTKAEQMPMPIDWEQLEQPEPWELNPF